MAHQANGHNYQFYGVGRNKSHRRSNGARPRKMYPYARKNQKGTPMEALIHNNYADLDELINRNNPGGPGVMQQGDADQGSKLGQRWGNIKRRMTRGTAANKYSKEHPGMSPMQAANHLVGLTGVSYGADPKQP